MWIILKNAQDITETYKKVADLEIEVGARELAFNEVLRQHKVLSGKIAGLEIENETLLREVAHWKAKAQVNKDENSRRQDNLSQSQT